MTDQLRKQSQFVKQETGSALTMPKAVEQKIIREFKSPMPSEGDERNSGILVKNAIWAGS